ncbi:PREDICTED: histone-lysine N-methyltransferase TRX1-like isoform X2 [Lupinus angustifolius]|uniref:histone-lysine N-methyltransferase TRX1-like isoform X2 n=1 Tax=Lupinus angustifolius TaxID=3871 RepID=UPI00092EBD91|nr:PREDICTED: histone-lysine N-methyltransferase TRX1-like isoform X2 [Lupinus angustifolius]
MKTRGTPSKSESGKSKVSEGGGEQVKTDSIAFGDVIWIKLRHGSWWPAQVVDAKSVDKSMKPRKRSVGDVLVRLYGSYKYSYVDPIQSRSEFETILKSNNGSYRDILLQSLEKDLPSNKSSKSKGSSSKGTPSKRKSCQKDDDDLDSESPETAALGKSQELSARRVRVMASLGLIAPPGSPFHKDGHNSIQNL